MPGEVISEANPPPMPSHLPASVLDLAPKVPQQLLDSRVLEGLKSFQNLAFYIAGAMIFLRDNVLLKRDLRFDDIKPRLLGHWGTCPGLILIWSHVNLLIQRHNINTILVVGPGHGAPAVLASLWIEGSLQKFYPDKYTVDRKGLQHLITKFSIPGGFPSHVNAETPGAIHEGGELGYALAVSFGAVMDRPELLVPCIVGDGEAETGPTAAAWHTIKYLDPAESGAVLPILHVNGFKISERTIYGCMDNKELISLFSGYGYQVAIVERLERINEELFSAMEWAVGEIHEIQTRARSGTPIAKPRWPMIVLRTPKGWSGPKMVNGKLIEGSFRSHQVPVPNAKDDKEQLHIVQDWLGSYKVDRLIEHGGKPIESVTSILPKDFSKRLGQNELAHHAYIPLQLPNWQEFGINNERASSSMEATGEFLKQVAIENPTSFRIFSPDELESNKLNAILDASGRNFQWDQDSRGQGGRVIEILSEHCCQGLMQGYTLTGRTALFPSYESFLGIVHTMMAQYAKFGKLAREVRWRGDLASVNYIETSTWARQEHNGFSHQQPSFIGAVLSLKANAARIYLPPDANCFLSTVDHCLRSTNKVNLMIGSKQPTAVYLTPNEAAEHCRRGASVWKFASTKGEPDVVLVGVGVEVTFEVIKAAELLRQMAPELNVRVVNVTDLLVLAPELRHPHALTRDEFVELFTPDKPIYFNYHGYAQELQGLLFGHCNTRRMTVGGYKEEGTTTTPFDMMLVNELSRFHIAEWALTRAGESAAMSSARGQIKELIKQVLSQRDAVKRYIMENGTDPDDTYQRERFN
ncbi:Xylulose 5-phosphate/Fructose 6-phosphate phosphoketolase [Cordyceps fumosorosea ARSEF 2679]|uniref:Xylulose 5-phosphate/Fructose 6-phosphate phosphoketolase n=1 Tax=Cordyceps fumosorosea (strain ARSEF 2679) TaxID=1081104 RepID=A0A162IGB8_CORFA|nr:Xylulose 5-phosphate/Fructose 6-phosphate phosphoketolase [Cordyceps fumosorosea ARSEF 2679]OAA56755.1 Xylulose 5-phosphate/Fructose 6-phosphate phosphoketolase [Cordyceps fumosorosea ARSEF 2679]